MNLVLFIQCIISFFFACFYMWNNLVLWVQWCKGYNCLDLFQFCFSIFFFTYCFIRLLHNEIMSIYVLEYEHSWPWIHFDLHCRVKICNWSQKVTSLNETIALWRCLLQYLFCQVSSSLLQESAVAAILDTKLLLWVCFLELRSFR